MKSWRNSRLFRSWRRCWWNSWNSCWNCSLHTADQYPWDCVVSTDVGDQVSFFNFIIVSWFVLWVEFVTWVNFRHDTLGDILRSMEQPTFCRTIITCFPSFAVDIGWFSFPYLTSSRISSIIWSNRRSDVVAKLEVIKRLVQSSFVIRWIVTTLSDEVSSEWINHTKNTVKLDVVCREHDWINGNVLRTV